LTNPAAFLVFRLRFPIRHASVAPAATPESTNDMKTFPNTTHANPAGIWPVRDRAIATSNSNTSFETELPMSTFAPLDDLDELDELDELDPNRQRPPDLPGDDVADESLAARAPIARCADGNGTMVGLFFSDHVVDIARAKAMCALCPVAQQCLTDALEREEPWGVWGGQSISGGRIIAAKRPCGRPPKVPRPEVIYDEMGPVGASLISA
jgi:WhiB family redox-sensing transcriptional regulator